MRVLKLQAHQTVRTVTAQWLYEPFMESVALIHDAEPEGILGPVLPKAKRRKVSTACCCMKGYCPCNLHDGLKSRIVPLYWLHVHIFLYPRR